MRRRKRDMRAWNGRPSKRLRTAVESVLYQEVTQQVESEGEGSHIPRKRVRPARVQGRVFSLPLAVIQHILLQPKPKPKPKQVITTRTLMHPQESLRKFSNPMSFKTKS